ncbi:MAG: RecB-family nuclease [Candidatus Thorarchaeota archaeon]|jgi:SpoU rRNA methylase family enzyme
MKNVYVVLHNVHAVSKVMETAQVVYGLGFPNFIVSKAEGSAAQTGVPESNRLAMKMKGSFAVLPGLRDVLEMLDVDRPLMITSPVLVKERLSPGEIAKRIGDGERVVIVLSGSNSSFSRKEMDMGECVSLEARVDIGPAGSAAIVLHEIARNAI